MNNLPANERLLPGGFDGGICAVLITSVENFEMTNTKTAQFFFGPLDGGTLQLGTNVREFRCYNSPPPAVQIRNTVAPVEPISEQEAVYVESRWQRGIFVLHEDFADVWNYHNDIFHEIRERRNKVIENVVAQLLNKERCTQEELSEVTLVLNVHQQKRLQTVEHLFYRSINLGTVTTDLNMPRPGVQFIPHEDFRHQTRFIVHQSL